MSNLVKIADIKTFRNMDEGGSSLFNVKQLLYIKTLMEQKHEAFTQYFFRFQQDTKFSLLPFHRLICETLDEVFKGNIKRLIINIPPGYGKTELVVKNFIARGFAINPGAKFIHTSYSEDLVMRNSSYVRNIVFSQEYQQLWPVILSDEIQSKKQWDTTQKGGMYSAASGSAITGFHAGRNLYDDVFTGALVIDDPLKPLDANYERAREEMKQILTNTLKSRIVNSRIPIVMIMQRLHMDDPTDFLLSGGTREMWHWLSIPVRPNKNSNDIDWLMQQNNYDYAIPIPYKINTPVLWPMKDSEEDLQKMEDSDPYTFSSQYLQHPVPRGGSVFRDEWWKFYDIPPNYEYKFITGDTAQKTDQQNDYTVFQCWGAYGGNIYLVDQVRGKWEAPELESQCVAFWNKHVKQSHTPDNLGKLRVMYIEDKSSGTGLIQAIKRGHRIPIAPIPRHKDKLTRAMDVANYVRSGYVYLPENARFLSEFLSEMGSFTPKMTHRHDDQVDAMIDALAIFFKQTMGISQSLMRWNRNEEINQRPTVVH